MTKSPIPAALLVCALGAVVASAQGPVPAPSSAPCDPQTQACLQTETWLLALRAWSPTGEQRDLAGLRGQAELRKKDLRLQGRLDGTASQGEFRQADLTTVRDVEAHLAGAWDALHLPRGVTIGPLVAVGAAVALEQQKQIRASIPRAVTAVVGARVGWPGGWAEGGCGAVQEWGRGVGCKLTYQLATSANGRIATVGTVSYGRSLVAATADTPAHSESGYFAWIGIAVRP